MSEEIREAVQIIEVAYDGIEIAMKVGRGRSLSIRKNQRQKIKERNFQRLMAKTRFLEEWLSGSFLMNSRKRHRRQ